ncbi:MAG: translocation/assembly module TamB domain-containing protein, partial [Candidatus Kapaibacterium sp.]
TLIDMQINQFLSTSVIVGTPISLRNIRYVKRRNSKEAKLYGRIVLKEGSKLSFFKTFDIEGDINFPTGNISNPSLDLTATYEGTTVDYKNYKVEIFVTGTKEKPDLRFEYEIGGDSGVGDEEKKLSNIITLLLTGRLSESGTGNGSGQEINLQSTIASDIITRQIAQELGKLGLSAQIDFDENFEDARVKIGGDI